MTIRHVVVWTLATEDTGERSAHAAEIVRRLSALDGVVPELRAITVGAEVLHPGTNADVVLIADFDSAADLDAYQVHPAHVEAARFVRSVVSSRVAVDFEV